MGQGHPIELPEGYVDFYKAIESWQNETFFRLKRKIDLNQLINDDFLRTLKQPVIEIREFVVEPQSYKAAFVELAELVARERESTRDMIERILTTFLEFDFADVYLRVVQQDQEYFEALANEHNFSRDMAIFLLDHSLRPFLRQFALPYQDSIASADISWDMGICPVCGFQSNLSWVRGEDGIRFLFCEHCFTEWQTRYLSCTYCGNSEPGSIKYLVIEGDDAHQIFVCDKCKGYLKTLDERKGPVSTGLFIAGIETVYLDLIAEEEGYTKNTENDRNLN